MVLPFFSDTIVQLADNICFRAKLNIKSKNDPRLKFEHFKYEEARECQMFNRKYIVKLTIEES